jgi:triacylglycerol lipase
MKVALAHGFLDTSRLFRTMARDLTALGHACHVPTVRPRDGRLGIPDLAEKFADHLDAEIPAGSELALVGFSMGALVARYYLQALPRRHRVKAFFSVAGPYRGTPTALLYPGLGTRQMRPGSAFLRELALGRDRLEGIAVHTYWTPLDLMVRPAAGARIEGGRDHRVWCPSTRCSRSTGR